MSKRILITGISGFIGTHVLRYYLANTDYTIIGVDSFRHKGTYSRINALEEYDPSRVKVYNHDLTVPIDPVTADRWSYEFKGKTYFQGFAFDYIINLASNSAVERSISNPSECWRNNCEIIINILDFACKSRPDIFIHVSTDEVYGDYDSEKKMFPMETPDAGFNEWSTILPSNPYAASKAAQEALCIAYWRTYDMPIIITNTMNNIGEFQDVEKFIPRIISQVSQDQIVSIYTDDEGNIGSRVYLDALDHADALHFLLTCGTLKLKPGGLYNRPSRFNVCGNLTLNNLEVAQMIAGILGKELKYELVPAQSARPGYDKSYLLNPALMESLGWTPKHSIPETFKRIVDYSLANPWWIQNVARQQQEPEPINWEEEKEKG